MQLILPFPPSMNGYWRSTGKGVLISARGRIFRANALAAIYQQLRCRPSALLTELDVHLILFPPTRAKRDLDNFQKALFDGLTHAGIWKDDSQVKRMLVEWGEVTKGGKAEITITDFKSAGVQPV
ncbi:MAG: RusA family crossover junction endodeoxyribonuclease [Rouxiella aceris]|uniref:RusA family crossover junction endodeoxyribonuclease n=1 Tax=Rouxiella aceris TaxID=2703884 RepID=UPI00284C662C|nr:RusA family crossover junction endodeoxyribonuclease [Rouxiella aceris]MDR3431070.1 RusA family crossover junction endodeoxyribonuclease [Rouxiella aceris]